MGIRIGINGFGRIGRTILRALSHHKDCEIVHINDLTDSQTISHLLRYDSVHGRFGESVALTEGGLMVAGKSISLSAIKNPAEIPWSDKKVDIVFECSGHFTKRKDAEGHLKGGAPKVLISSPATDEDLTVVYGVNHEKIQKSHTIISNGSCTTNCLAPVAKVIHEKFGIVSGLVTTVHSYTNDQRILDLPHSDLRRSRAAAVNMIPTSTGAAKAIGLVLPELKGLVDGLAIRVPTPNVSVVDATFELQTSNVTIELINNALQEASLGNLKGILGYTEEPLVSSDFNGDPRSSIVDATMTKVIKGKLVKILAWYDNETGFSHRMLDVAKLMVK